MHENCQKLRSILVWNKNKGKMSFNFLTEFCELYFKIHLKILNLLCLVPLRISLKEAL